jgi:pimeloyl-ACP methyl ester carboxylesterase
MRTKVWSLRSRVIVWMLVGCTLSAFSAFAVEVAWTDKSLHRQGFVTANGVKLQYLDWGGTGPALIFLAGLGENPHIFDDIAPGFVDRFHVLAYARRGHDLSEVRPPYDTDTLTEDLRSLMDALQIDQANLVGWSLGGNEITWMAEKYPDRVLSLIYLDAAYDWSDPELKSAFEAFPSELRQRSPSANGSLNSYREYMRSQLFRGLQDLSRVEAYIRESVVVQADGTVEERMPPELEQAFYDSLWTNPRLDYTKVHAPVLAIYATSTVDQKDPDVKRRQAAKAWEGDFMEPFRVKSIERVKTEIPTALVMIVPGRHNSFFLIAREHVITSMRQFLFASARRS